MIALDIAKQFVNPAPATKTNSSAISGVCKSASADCTLVDFHRDVTRFFHRELTHLEIMRSGSWLGQDIAGLLLFSGGGFDAGLEAEAVVSSFQDVAAVGEAVEERRGHLGVAEDRGPFAEAEIGGDDDAGALVKLAQKMEELNRPGFTGEFLVQ